MWQELRDNATRTFASTQSNNDRIISVVQSALSNEAFMTSTDFGASTKREELFTLLRTVTGGTGTYIPPDEDRGR